MNKTALITGGSSGIGLATAITLSNLSYDVTIISRDSHQLACLAKKFNIKTQQADVQHVSELNKLSEQFSKNGLDVLINNAAYARPQPLPQCSEKEYEQHFNTNVRGPLFLTQYLLEALKKKQGCVTNISSIITSKPVSGFTFYTASKGALEMATKSLALELAPYSIRVNAICPGAIDTPMHHKLHRSEQVVQAIRKEKIKAIPLQRFGLADEVVKLVLAQIDSTYVTGSIWHVDGGLSL